MRDFDKYLRNRASQEKRTMPESVQNNIEKTLSKLPESNSTRTHSRMFPRFVAAAACFLILALFILPNISSVYAKALEKVPIIGEIVQVFTIRNYHYSDERHEMNVNVPKVDIPNHTVENMINNDIEQWVEKLTGQFYKDLKNNGNSGHSSIKSDYEIVTNTKQWFTLKFSITETMASSNRQLKYYHIDKSSGEIVQFGDLFQTKEYSDAIAKIIRKQMIQQMNADPSLSYWMKGSSFGKDFSSVGDNQNFYWKSNGNLVVIFDEYEVGPGYMGTPSFVIRKEQIKNILKPKYYHMEF